MTGAVAHEKFGFDTQFGDGGEVFASPRPPRVRHAYASSEVETIRNQAFAEGQAAQRATDDGVRAQALAEIADACRRALPTVSDVIERYRIDAAELATATGAVVADAALEQFPRAPLRAALEALAGEIDGAARLIVRAPLSDPAMVAAIEQAAADAGLPGRILTRDEPGSANAAFIIEWPDGRAEYDPHAALERVRAALHAALAIEADHPSGDAA